MDITIKKELVVGEVVKGDGKKIQVSLIDSNIGEFVAATDMYEKQGEWKSGKGKWFPIDVADEVAALILKAYKVWEEC